MHFVSLLRLFVWLPPGERLPRLSRSHFTITVCFTEQPFLMFRLHLPSTAFVFRFLLRHRRSMETCLCPRPSVSSHMPICRSAGGGTWEERLTWDRFSVDMIIEYVPCQIKAALMKDRHHSAASLERLRGIATSWLSGWRNMVTHPPLISLTWPIDRLSYPLAWLS